MGGTGQDMEWNGTGEGRERIEEGEGREERGYSPQTSIPGAATKCVSNAVALWTHWVCGSNWH